MKPTVLIVDDEKDLLDLVRYHIEKAGIACLEAQSGEMALQIARERTPELIILDLMLPGMDGLEVCKHLRKDQRTASVSIIMLTAKAEEIDRIVGLEMGADDYMVKPFSPRELLARIKAIFRRGPLQEITHLKRIGTLEIDEGKHQVTVQGNVINLTVKEFALLCALIKAKGRVLNRDQILETVWGYSNVIDIVSRTVDVHIRRLREKLGEERKRILTIKGVGYRFDVEST